MSLLDSTKNTIHGFYKAMMEGAMSVQTTSEFQEKGTLTPDEFVEAGNKLVNQCPTWTWEEGDADKKKAYFKDKQFLQTRNVPCLARVASLLQLSSQEHDVENGEWLAMDDDERMKKVTDQIADIDLDNVPEIGSSNDNSKQKTKNNNNNNNKNDENNNMNSENNNGKGIINIVEHSAFNESNIEKHNETNNNKTTQNNNNTINNNEDDIDDLSDSYEEIPDIETFNDDDNVVSKNTDNKNENLQNGTKNNDNSKNTNDNNSNNNNNNNNNIDSNNNDNDTDEKKIDESKQQPMFKLKQEDDTIVKTRTYDISITYDKYYKVPRIWLRGYDENANPLTSSQIFEDISADHAHKTVTVETHPHMNVVCAGIHPCRHSEVMKRFMDRLEETGQTLSVDQYMFLFLKFMSAVIPTIEYDWTESVDG